MFCAHYVPVLKIKSTESEVQWQHLKTISLGSLIAEQTLGWSDSCNVVVGLFVSSLRKLTIMTHASQNYRLI